MHRFKWNMGNIFNILAHKYYLGLFTLGLFNYGPSYSTVYFNETSITMWFHLFSRMYVKEVVSLNWKCSLNRLPKSIWVDSQSYYFKLNLIQNLNFFQTKGVCFFNFLLKIICFQTLNYLFFYFFVTYYKFLDK